MTTLGFCGLQTQLCLCLGDNKYTGNTSGGSGTLQFSILYLNLVPPNQLAPPSALPSPAMQASLWLIIFNLVDSGRHSMGLGPTNMLSLCHILVLCQYHPPALNPPTHPLPTHTPSTRQLMTTPPPHDPHALIA